MSSPMARNTLTQERARELFDYRDGNLYWRIRPAQRIKAGDRAGNKRQISIKGVQYQTCRLIYIWHHGCEPDEIDHMNGDPFDHRIENLRSVSRSENNWNRVPRGCFFSNSIGKWQAFIRVHTKNKFLGNFDTEEAAHAAYVEAKSRLHVIDGRVANCHRT